ncbi:MAG: Rhs element Vgr protein [Bryobacterales bacterium]|nr:Rhs element Vgr protein [Bryobacterales bacterium]
MKALTELPGVRVTVDGSSLPIDTMRCLDRVLVAQELSSPTVCELVFRGTPKALDGFRFCAGAALRVHTDHTTEALFDGQITAMEHKFGPDSTRELRVRAYDRLHCLRKRQPVRVHVQTSLADLARELTADLGFAVEQTESSPVWNRVFQYRQSDLELLVELGARCGQYLALRGDTLHLLTLQGAGAAIPLKLGDSLLEASVELNDNTACRSVMASGWNSSRWEDFRGLALDARLGRDIAHEVVPSEPGGNGERTLVDEWAEDADHAVALAQAELDARAAGEVTFRGVAEGNPRLRPGVPIDIAGLGSDVSGRFVLAKAVHTVERQTGYLSEISTTPPTFRARSKGTVASPGVVSRVDDPEGLGRVKVKLTTYQDLETDWMGVLSPGAGGKKGFIMIPDVSDQVLVLFSHNDPAQGVVLGGLFGVHAPPDAGVEGGSVRRFSLLTPGGQRIRLDDGRNEIHIEDSTGSYLKLSPAQVFLHCKVGMTLEAPGQPIVIQAKSIDFKEA